MDPGLHLAIELVGAGVLAAVVCLLAMGRLVSRKTAELAATAARERENSRLKSEFLANISHEIRTPLNGVIGMQTLVLGSHLEAEARECLEIAQDSAQSLLVLLNDLLDLTRIEAGRLEMADEPFSVAEVVEECLRTLAARAGEKRLPLESRLQPGIPRRVRGDALRLRQVLLNLVGNAIKFTDRGHVRVTVSALGETPAGARLQFVVEDTGIGIAPEDQRLIFEAFRQADGSPTRRFGGSGLGLAISERLVTMMGGRIGVESWLGQGSRFHFTTLFAVAAETAPEAAPELTRAQTGPHGHLRVLVAEDNLVNQKLVVRLLEKRGCQVAVANNGTQALAVLAETPVDLILMDVQMPEVDGLEATRAIRQHERHSGAHVPIVALTAHAMAGDAERCLGAGMDRYLSKPVRSEELFEVIEELAGRGARV
jgi:signal transduction histidine kinase/ActR/RegA family two-component response regulator